MSWYYLNLENGSENCYTSKEGSSTHPAGALLAAFLDVDWEKWQKECALNPESQEEAHGIAVFYFRLCEEIAPLHPLLDEFVRQQLWGDMFSITSVEGVDAVACANALHEGKEDGSINEETARNIWKQFSKRFAAFNDFRNKLEVMMDSVLDAGGEYGDLSVIQRYALMRKSDYNYAAAAEKFYSSLKPECILFTGGRMKHMGFGKDEIRDEDLKEIKQKKLSAHIYQTSDSLEALLLWEFDYMAAHELPMRRCEYCGRYFIPHSVASRYCDRPTSERSDKTCKDIGSMQKYQTAVNRDEAKKLYQRTNNRVQTWTTRNADVYPDARRKNYRLWQFEAQKMLEQVSNGEMDFETFKKAMTGNPKKLLGLDK